MSKITVQMLYLKTTPDGDKVFKQMSGPWKDGEPLDGEVFVNGEISINKGVLDETHAGSVTVTIQED